MNVTEWILSLGLLANAVSIILQAKTIGLQRERINRLCDRVYGPYWQGGGK